MDQCRVFSHPEPKSASVCLKPVFLPFAGCGRRCFFCAQHLQTGCGTKPLAAIYRELESWLIRAEESGHQPVELGFYAGTFTSLPDDWTDKFLNLATKFRRNGLVCGVRASTRPDAALLTDLSSLAAKGLDLLELGIQSFNESVLNALGRGYGLEQAELACQAAVDAGLGLGLHLMPGSPAMDMNIFEQDLMTVMRIKPRFIRLHPCLVLSGTSLEQDFLNGRFKPWDLSCIVRILSSALLRLWKKEIKVVRMGLAAEPDLQLNIVAGPWHPCLGLLVRSQALHDLVRLEVERFSQGEGPLHLRYPRRFCGEIWGHRGCLRPAYEKLALSQERVKPWNKDDFCLWRGDDAFAIEEIQANC